jgi:hypothetical protein
MTDRPHFSDDEILNRVDEALDAEVTLSEGFVDIVMAGYALETTDFILAELVLDTDLDSSVAAVRDASLQARVVEFRAPGISFEFEIAAATPEVAGRIKPVQAGRLDIQQDGAVVDIPLDERGRFMFRLESTSPLRLRYTPDDGPSVVTPWIIP